MPQPRTRPPSAVIVFHALETADVMSRSAVASAARSSDLLSFWMFSRAVVERREVFAEIRQRTDRRARDLAEERVDLGHHLVDVDARRRERAVPTMVWIARIPDHELQAAAAMWVHDGRAHGDPLP
ncbi:hypothetical protein PINS_up023059 [Pythium insidiosum]|nr:hypothetical protein PINS_up023059 [Pythium insidiosum]